MNTQNSTSFDALISQGMAASRTNDSAQAIECFQKATATKPQDGLPQFLLGAEYAALGDMKQAETAFANATLLAPDFPMARYQLGLLQFSSGRAGVALLTWQPLLELPESDPLPHFVRGFAALAQDHFDEALRYYCQGLERNTSNAALSNDIQKVVSSNHALGVQVQSGGGDRAGVAAQDPAGGDEDASNHVLLANYQQQGRPH